MSKNFWSKEIPLWWFPDSTLKLNNSRTAWPIPAIYISFSSILNARSYEINLFSRCSSPLKLKLQNFSLELHKIFRIFLETFFLQGFVIRIVNQLITPNLKSTQNFKIKVSRKIHKFFGSFNLKFWSFSSKFHVSNSKPDQSFEVCGTRMNRFDCNTGS